MTDVLAFTQLLVGILTLITLVFGLIKMFSNAHEARAHRVAATDAAIKAQQAATLASRRVAVADKKVDQIVGELAQIKDATNGLNEVLRTETAKASFAEGVQSERDRNGR